MDVTMKRGSRREVCIQLCCFEMDGVEGLWSKGTVVCQLFVTVIRHLNIDWLTGAMETILSLWLRVCVTYPGT